MANYSDADIAFAHRVFQAARDGATSDLAAVIDAGLSPDLTNDKGDTLLILAAYYTRTETVAMLLAKGADPTRFNDRGQDALGSAVFRQSRPTVETLLAAGADPTASPRSAWSVAQFFGLSEMVDLLRPHVTDPDAPGPEGRGADHAVLARPEMPAAPGDPDADAPGVDPAANPRH